MAQPLPESDDDQARRDATGHAIHAARRSRGWSQQHLADQLGVRREAVVGWEHGHHTPKPVLWDRIEEVLHLRVDPTVPGGFRLAHAPTGDPQAAPAPGTVNVYVVVTSADEAAAVVRRLGAQP